MQTTYEVLQQAWKPLHYNHLLYCLKEHKPYYEDSFTYVNIDNTITIDGKIVLEPEIIYTLAIYYEDNTTNYQTAFRDFVYLCFTDLVDTECDILDSLEE